MTSLKGLIVFLCQHDIKRMHYKNGTNIDNLANIKININ